MLPWETTKRLLRLQGVADELLATARAGTADSPEALAFQVDSVIGEVRSLLAEHDAALAGEFERMVARADRRVDAGRRACCGSRRLAASGAERRVAGSAARGSRASTEARRRKQTIGFKIRSPITREQEPEQS